MPTQITIPCYPDTSDPTAREILRTLTPVTFEDGHKDLTSIIVDPLGILSIFKAHSFVVPEDDLIPDQEDFNKMIEDSEDTLPEDGEELFES